MRKVLRVSPLKECSYQYQEPVDMDIEDMADSPPSLVFSLEGEESADDACSQPPSDEAVEAIEQLEWLLQPSSDAEGMLKLAVQLARPFLRKGADQHMDLETLCAMLQRAGYTAKLHTQAGTKFSNLRHQYLTVCLPDGSNNGLSMFVVDPNFKDSFLVAHPTRRYAAVLDSLPAEVVASQACLRRAVTILSGELARSFTEQGSPVPPWRTQAALLSKWQLVQPSSSQQDQQRGGAAPAAAKREDAVAAGAPAFGGVS